MGCKTSDELKPFVFSSESALENEWRLSTLLEGSGDRFGGPIDEKYAYLEKISGSLRKCCIEMLDSQEEFI